MNPSQNFLQNTEGQDYVVGDLHGHFGLLQEGLQKIGFNRYFDRLFSVGDLIDRGPESTECLELIKRPWFHAVLGNHEDMMLKAESSSEQNYLWILNGGSWHTEIPVTKLIYLRSLAQTLPLAITVDTENGPVGICHAEPASDDWTDSMDPSTNREQHDILWGRDVVRLHEWQTEGVYMTVHGHTPLKKPRQIGNALFIDTGAFATGNLTILNLGNI